jgi:hypothetical protein
VILIRTVLKNKEYFALIRTINRRQVNWIGHILRENCLLLHSIQEKMEGTKRRRKRRKLLLDISCKTEDTGT